MVYLKTAVSALLTLGLCACSLAPESTPNSQMPAGLTAGSKQPLPYDPEFEFDSSLFYKPVKINASQLKPQEKGELSPYSPLVKPRKKGDRVLDDDMLTDQERAQLRKQALNLPPDPTVQQANQKIQPFAPNAGVNFEGFFFKRFALIC